MVGELVLKGLYEAVVDAFNDYNESTGDGVPVKTTPSAKNAPQEGK
jgi:hypothetical protein